MTSRITVPFHLLFLLALIACVSGAALGQTDDEAVTAAKKKGKKTSSESTSSKKKSPSSKAAPEKGKKSTTDKTDGDLAAKKKAGGESAGGSSKAAAKKSSSATKKKSESDAEESGSEAGKDVGSDPSAKSAATKPKSGDPSPAEKVTEIPEAGKPASKKLIGEDQSPAEKAAIEAAKKEKGAAAKSAKTPAAAKTSATSSKKKATTTVPPAIPDPDATKAVDPAASPEERAKAATAGTTDATLNPPSPPDFTVDPLPGDSDLTSKPSPVGINATPAPRKNAKGAPPATLSPDQLQEWEEQNPKVQALLRSALELTSKNLTYSYGSADPANGGMDCSGFIYYTLRQNGFAETPRQASEQYVWARKARSFHAVVSKKPDSFEFDDLRPGDLLFWTGTYSVDRDPPITHSMIYLGREKGTGNRVMVGSSDGRSYQGKARWGVSVFDFKMPGATGRDGQPSRANFVGYAKIPGLKE